MARSLQSIVKMSRREGYALHPKAHKALLKRPSPPGQQQRNMRAKTSQYSLQLREKQKAKRMYGLLEKQFSNMMKEASKMQGQAGEHLLVNLEKRLDNTVYRAGYAPSRQAARQLVSHGHFNLNGKRVDIPSIRVKIGDLIELRPKSQTNEYFKKLDDVSPAPSIIPDWLSVNRKKFDIKIVGLPVRDDVEPDINEQLIVEYYSR
ncbi:MAG: 30S ribosomal protein S4 [bacterium]